MNKPHAPHPRIVLGLPDLQDQIRLVNRLSASAAEPELGRWDCLANLLSELYAQLQHQKQVTVYRFGSKSCCAADAERDPALRDAPKSGRSRG